MVKRSAGNFYVKWRYFYATLTLWCFLLTLMLFMQPSQAAISETQLIDNENVLEVFVRDGCPHCKKAKEFLLDFGDERPWLSIVYHSVDHDSTARDDLLRYSKAAGIWPPGVPAFRFNGQLLVGFDSPEHTGSLLTALVEQTAIHSERVETSLFGTLSVSNLGLPLFTLAMGLLDGFNPCAMWVLLFLLSMLVHIQDRKRMILIAGTFVLVSGAIYYPKILSWMVFRVRYCFFLARRNEAK